MFIINNTCWGDYPLQEYAKNLKAEVEKLGVEVQLRTQNFDYYKGIKIRNLNGDGLILENKSKFIILHYGDNDTAELQALEQHPDCEGVISVNRFKEQNLYNLELPYHEKKYLLADEMYAGDYCDSFDRLANSGYFSGVLFPQRVEYFTEVQKHISITVSTDRLPQIEYFLKLKQYKVILSPPGGCDINTRDIECFGLGIPIVRDEYKYRTDLIPGIHYISTGIVQERGFKLFEDKQYLNNISMQSREYYSTYIKNQPHFQTIITNFLSI
tara:strand:- start:1303 stop:2112 length:810 start_codon:yes stop_codon:yes gene_type:complete